MDKEGRWGLNDPAPTGSENSPALRTHVESCNLYNYVPFSQMGTLRHRAV